MECLGEKPPRIAFFDVENSPSLGWFYDLYTENNIVATEQPWFMLSFAWAGSENDRVHHRSLPDYPGYKRNKTNDKKLICDLWNLFDSNDVLVGHNIRRFDTRKANARFLHWGLKPPSPYVILDSYVEYKKIAYLDRNSLDFIDKFTGGPGKMVTEGWPLHRRAIGGDKSAWRILTKYNGVDVLRAKKVWNIIAPWKKNHPALFDTGCKVCGSDNLHRRGPVRQSKTKFQFACLDCGHWQVKTLGKDYMGLCHGRSIGGRCR